MCKKPRGGKISQTIFILESKFGQENYGGILSQAILLLKRVGTKPPQNDAAKFLVRIESLEA